ncbi:hypothetical protein [Microvirga pudoricolor]|jgi:hypothetical protein|uniref:hypothetical protein n=1 Tax=Microvirga pudoricolor TaxID=2778729 RepID=UPI0019525556|nr:hypothetical protein [Microvirga pudoricolor]MBM6593235.1 hypothetical protein [Microvirga pudoricolor]
MPLLTEAIAEAVGAIDAALLRLDEGTDAVTGLNDVRSHILSVLWLVERNPGIEAAADDLYQAAAAFVRAKADPSTGNRHKRILNDAMARFRERLAMAVPSVQAQRLGLA